MGHNHSGTLGPAAGAVIPFVVEIAREGGPWARDGALSILADVVVSFEVPSQFEWIDAPDGSRVRLMNVIRSRIYELADVLLAILADPDAMPTTRFDALDILTSTDQFDRQVEAVLSALPLADAPEGEFAGGSTALQRAKFQTHARQCLRWIEERSDGPRP